MPKSASPDDQDPSLVRKKKNADAQAAFRARRQNYISTLEETVTSLESVVIQLQDSCRETRTENLQLRQENSRLRFENREREKYWKAFVQARKSAQSPPFPPTPDSYNTYRPPPADYQTVATSSFPFTNHDDAPYSIPDSTSNRDPRWQLPTPQSQSSSYLESPSADLGYPARFPTNDRKVALDAVLNSAPYVFPAGSRYHDSIPNSRSMSPTTSASSPTSLPLTSSYQLPFQDPSTAQDHPDFEYRGQSLPQVTLHGGIADISLAAYRFTKRPDSIPENQDHLPLLPQNEDAPTRLRANRRNIAHPYRRSQSPGPTPLSSTVAVIKAQAFGALRRTRAKTKKTTDSAARVAQDVLEARGIGVGPMPTAKPNELYDVGKD